MENRELYYITFIRPPIYSSVDDDDDEPRLEAAATSYPWPLLSLRCFAGGQIYLDVPPSEGEGSGAPPTAPPPHI